MVMTNVFQFAFGALTKASSGDSANRGKGWRVRGNNPGTPGIRHTKAIITRRNPTSTKEELLKKVEEVLNEEDVDLRCFPFF